MDFGTFVVSSTFLVAYGILLLVAISSEKEQRVNFWKEAIEAARNGETWPLILLAIAFSGASIFSVVLGAILNPIGREVILVVEMILLLWGINIVSYHDKEMFVLEISLEGQILSHKGLPERKLRCLKEKAPEIAKIFEFCCEGEERGKKIVLKAVCNKYFPLCKAGLLQVNCLDSQGRAIGCFPERDKREHLKRIFKECGINILKIL